MARSIDSTLPRFSRFTQAVIRLHEIRTDGQMHNAPLNLDDLPMDELRALSDLPMLHESVREYAFFKALAVEYRERSGEIDRALKLERKCDRVYGQIPAHLRW